MTERTLPRVPTPDERPTLDLWPEAGQLLGLSKMSMYNAARSGQIPTIRVGRRILVPTAALRRLLGLDDAPKTPGEAA